MSPEAGALTLRALQGTSGPMSAQRRVRVIQHMAGEGPGLIAVALEREGVAVEVTRVDLDVPFFQRWAALFPSLASSHRFSA